jgi:hypothetical protein
MGTCSRMDYWLNGGYGKNKMEWEQSTEWIMADWGMAMRLYAIEIK